MQFDMNMLLGLLISGAATYWVYTDAKSRNMNYAWMWATLTFLVIIVGLPLYVILRKPLTKK
jgi:high-affinity Fe2+/Pb2+ permease